MTVLSEDPYELLREARDAKDEADRLFQEIVVQAIATGASYRRVAAASGLALRTVWLWTHPEEGSRKDRGGTADTARPTTTHGGSHEQQAAE